MSTTVIRKLQPALPTLVAILLGTSSAMAAQKAGPVPWVSQAIWPETPSKWLANTASRSALLPM
jgi:hypothetical protein